MNKNAACTIVSKNYFAYALTLRESYLQHHVGCDFHILIVDAKDSAFVIPSGVDVTWVEDLGISEFKSYAMRYDILELNTNVKPTFLLHLLKRYAKVAYIDPDIRIYRELDVIYGALDSCSVVITPHIVSPIEDGLKPGEVDFLLNGQFNLGFIAVRNDDTGIAAMTWWERRCLEQGYNEPARGLFVDQKWINLLPCLFDGVRIEKALGCNMAYWNLHERRLGKQGDQWLVNEVAPLYFFHFSGLALNDADQISKHQNRYDLVNRADLRELFAEYRKALAGNGHAEFQKFKYGFARFSNGKPVSQLARRLYSISPFCAQTADPFAAAGEFYAFCERKKLMASESGPKSYNTYNTDQNDVRLRIIRRGLGFAHKLLGSDRYQLLLKYMGYISSVRNQGTIFLDQPK